MSTLSNFIHSRRRLLSWLSGILISYSLLGFFLLPWLVESQLEKFLDERLDVTSELENVYFNPFSFYFELEQLRLTDAEQGDLMHLGTLRLNFQASRLGLLKLQFSEIRIANLDVYYARDGQEDDTVSRMAARWLETAAEAESTTTEAPETTDTAESSELIPLEILSLSLASISLNIVDAVPSTPFETTLSLAQAQIDNFSTLPDQSGNNTLSLIFEENAQLDWSGGFTVNPLDFNGEIALRNFSMLPVSRYLQDTLPFRLDDGHIDLSLSYDIDLSGAEPRITADDIDFSIQDLTATQRGAPTPFIEATEILLAGGNVSIPENRAEFASLSLENIDINGVRDELGVLNFQQMSEAMLPGEEPGATGVEPAPETAAGSNPWFFSLASATVVNNRVSFLDNSLQNPFSIATAINATVTDIDNQTGTHFPFSTTVTLDSGGSIDLGGQLQALPSLELESSLVLSGIALPVAQSYLNELAYLELMSGALDLDAEIAVNQDEPFSFRGGVSLSDVAVNDLQLDETIFSLGNLGIDALSLSLANNDLEISELTLDGLFARILINEDGSNNIGHSIKPGTETAAPAAQASAQSIDATPLAVTVGQVNLVNASANFTDRNLPLPFHADIQNLEGVIQGFANNSSQATDINLEGQVDEFGLVQIVSSVNPFDYAANSEIDVNFSNIDMPSMSPYVIKFAGREIAEGKVDVELIYSFLEGELDANNQVVLSALRLGERVEQPDAMDLPLDLAIALLKDGNGVIDLEVPITGNVNDPEFDFGPAIRRAISNILTNIVAAPFRLLSNLVGGGDEGALDQVRFQPGRADIAAPERETLLQLSEALKQRPQLVLEIPPISAAADELALQITAVDANIESLLEAQGESEDSLTDRRMAAVETLYNSAGLDQTLDAIRLLHTQAPEIPDAELDTAVQQTVTGELDTLAYIADLRDRLIAAETITANELAALATARTQAVAEFLSTNGEVAAARLITVDAVTDADEEEGWLILPFGLTAQ